MDITREAGVRTCVVLIYFKWPTQETREVSALKVQNLSETSSSSWGSPCDIVLKIVHDVQWEVCKRRGGHCWNCLEGSHGHQRRRNCLPKDTRRHQSCTNCLSQNTRGRRPHWTRSSADHSGPSRTGRTPGDDFGRWPAALRLGNWEQAGSVHVPGGRLCCENIVDLN